MIETYLKVDEPTFKEGVADLRYEMIQDIKIQNWIDNFLTTYWQPHIEWTSEKPVSLWFAGFFDGRHDQIRTGDLYHVKVAL